MIVVTMRNGHRISYPEAGATVAAGVFPTEAGASPAPALFIRNTNGEPVAVLRSAEVAYYALAAAVSIATP